MMGYNPGRHYFDEYKNRYGNPTPAAKPTPAPTPTYNQDWAREQDAIRKRQAMEAQRQAELAAQRQAAQRAQYAQQQAAAQEAARLRARQEAARKAQEAAKEQYGGQFGGQYGVNVPGEEDQAERPGVGSAIVGGIGGFGQWLANTLGGMGTNLAMNQSYGNLFNRGAAWMQNPLAAAQYGNVFAPEGDERNMIDRPASGFGNAGGYAAPIPQYGFYDPANPGRNSPKVQATGFGNSSVYAAPYEGEGGRWAASNGLEYRQINPFYGVQDQGGGGGGGYGGYPGWSFPGYGGGGYDYPEPAKSWYENMLQWRI